MASDGFELVDEVAGVFAPSRWMLVGGLMVHAHARLAGITNARSTDDADIVVEIRPNSGYTGAVDALRTIGFEPYESLDHQALSYRFTRGRQHIDLMAPDRSAEVRLGRRAVLQVPGSHSALKRTEVFRTAAGSLIRVPDIAGALSLKGAAYQTPSHNPVRHLQDAVVLFACAEVRGVETPSKSMRTNINVLLRDLGTSPEAWSLADRSLVRLATRAIQTKFRADWRPPSFVGPQRLNVSSGQRRGKTTPASNRTSFAPRVREEPTDVDL